MEALPSPQSSGTTALTGYLIAALALRHDTTVWHCDEDYVRIAAVSDLRHRDLRPAGP